ncbi:MAG: hypothetical protein AAF548_06835 [Actinomycetota bacterium]
MDDALGARGGRFNTALRRLVVVVLGLNLLVLAALVAVVAVGDDDADDAEPGEAVEADIAAPTSAPTAIPSTSAPTTSAAPEPPAVLPAEEIAEPVDSTPAQAPEPPAYPALFEPTANEPQPDAKRMGAFIAYLITNYDADASLADVLATLPAGAAEIAGLPVEVDVVHHPGMWSRGTVEYVQLGGHLNGRISNIVVIRQDIGIDGDAEPSRIERRVMEVRLARDAAGAWRLETIASAGGDAVERPADLSEIAAAVVDHDRIDLPDTAAWDIYRGLIDRQVLQVMLDIADRTPYAVVVLQTGHSYNVFGTDRVSNHSVGRAVDIYKLDDELVVDSHDTSSDFYALSEWIVSRDDIREFGSPWKFPGAVAHTFTNEVHHDHLHIGVNPQ